MPVSPFDETLPIINRLAIFESFSDNEKRQIVSEDAHFRVYQSDELLIRAGSSDQSLFVLLTGTVTITDPSGQTVFAILKPGDIFGEMAFLTDTRRTANVKARECTIALKLDRVLFDRLSPQIREKFKDRIIEKLVARLDRANKELSRSDTDAGKTPSESRQTKSSTAKSSSKIHKAPNYLHGRKLIRRVISQTSELPAMPDVMVKVQQKLRLPGTSPIHLTKIIETDPAIVAGILKIANSAYYGFRGKVSTVRHASALFGTRRLAELITSMSSSGMLGKALNGYALKSGDMWRHSIAVARTSSEIASTVAPDVADNALYGRTAP
jgi:CRP/FNR family cyclic AMP-dependent transcriptional regulator